MFIPLDINGGDYFGSMESAQDAGPDGYEYNYDPLFYHVRLVDAEVIKETAKAMFIKWKQGSKTVQKWIPKSIIKFHRAGDIYAHRKTLVKLMKQ